MKLKRILLAEDNPKDIELALEALEEHNLANDVVVVRNGAEALDYLYRRGEFSTRPLGILPLSYSISKCRKWTVWKFFDRSRHTNN